MRQLEVKLAYCKEAAGPSDCKRMLSKENAAAVKDADAHMCQWRKLIEALPDGMTKLKLPQVQTTLSLGDMSMAAFTLSLNLPGEDLKKYKSREALAHDVVLILQVVLGCTLASPWEAHAQEPAVKDSETSKAGVQLMRELNEDGSVKDSACLLNEAGFFVGSWVRRKADAETGCICSAQNGKVSLKQADRVVRVSLDAFLDGQWVIFTPKAEPQVLDDVRIYSPKNSPEYQRNILLANCVLDLSDLYEKYEESAMWDRLQVNLKPRKSLSASGFIGKGKLVLCPASLQIKTGIKKPDDALLIQQPNQEFEVWIQATCNLPKAEGDPGFLNPCFFVQPLTDESACNMEVFYVKSTRSKQVRLPLLRNSCDLQEGQVLYILKGSKQAVLEPLSPETPPKKRIRAKGMQ